MTDPAPTPWRDLGDGPVYEREPIWLPQLVARSLAAGQPEIVGKTFIECRIEGPAVLLAVGGCDFDGCDMGYHGGDVRNLLLRPVGPQKVIGAIAFRDCVFRRCQFAGVGFTGAPAFLDSFIQVLGGGQA